MLSNKSDFTKREKEIIELMKLGYSNTEIAERLYISVGTVRVYVTNLLIKTNSKNRTNLIFNLAKIGYFEHS